MTKRGGLLYDQERPILAIGVGFNVCVSPIGRFCVSVRQGPCDHVIEVIVTQSQSVRSLGNVLVVAWCFGRFFQIIQVYRIGPMVASLHVLSVRSTCRRANDDRLNVTNGESKLVGAIVQVVDIFM